MGTTFCPRGFLYFTAHFVDRRIHEDNMHIDLCLEC